MLMYCPTLSADQIVTLASIERASWVADLADRVNAMARDQDTATASTLLNTFIDTTDTHAPFRDVVTFWLAKAQTSGGEATCPMGPKIHARAVALLETPVACLDATHPDTQRLLQQLEEQRPFLLALVRDAPMVDPTAPMVGLPTGRSPDTLN